jgi:Chitobiase/beta-hexosaminidase C-terminal domain/Bacterial Ig-like domain (group 3)
MPVSAFRRSSKAILAATVTLGLAGLQAQSSLQITSPADGTVFNPGQTIAVTVGPTGAGFSYLAVDGQYPLEFGIPVPGATNQFSVLIPTTTPPGYYTFAAAGLTTQGQTVFSPQIKIAVQRTDAPIRLSVEPSIFELNVGEKGNMHVWGAYGDGSNFFLSYAPNTTYLSNKPSIATVDSQGIITAVSPGSTTIVVNGSAIVSVQVDPPMTIAPPKKALYAGQSQQFTPRLGDRSIPPVSWSSNPPDVGSVGPTGVYTAPPQITLQQPVILTATSLADNTISATATITLLPPLALSVAPSSVNLSQSQTAQFYTSLSNAVNPRVKWSLNPVGVGQISPLGLYTAPATIGSPQTVALTAKSRVDGVTGATATILLSSSGAATVTVAANASVPYSTADQVLSLNSTVTSAGSPVSTGTVTFTVMQGGSTIGAAATSSTLANGVANAGFTLPGGTAAGSYIIQAVYNAGLGYLTSIDTAHTLTVTSLTVAAPTFSPAGGTYSAGQMVAISTVTPGASIRYTTNGSAPSETAGTLYSGPITVSSTTTISALAYASGMTDSAIATSAYTIAVSVSVSPTSQSLSQNQTQQFTATVTNAANTAVVWTLSPSVGVVKFVRSVYGSRVHRRYANRGLDRDKRRGWD